MQIHQYDVWGGKLTSIQAPLSGSVAMPIPGHTNTRLLAKWIRCTLAARSFHAHGTTTHIQPGRSS